MRRVYRLRERGDFRLLFRYGTRIQSPIFQLTVRPNKLGHARFAFITPRSIAKRARDRNRMRRRAREWARKQSSLLERPFDAALLFKKAAVQAPRKDFYEELMRIFKKVPDPRS